MKPECWESPLLKGQRVRTDDGFLVSVEENPKRSGSSYTVKVKIITAPEPFQGLGGKTVTWEHRAPYLFLRSSINSIDGRRVNIGISVMEEFFSRISKQPS